MLDKVLYIASNIPLENRRGNTVILDLAQKMSEQFKIEFIYPKPFVPFILKWNKKHGPNYNLKPWKVGDINIFPQTFFRLPFKNNAFKLFKKFKYPFRGEKPILSHAHFLIPDGIFSYYLYRDQDIPYVITLRGADVRKLEKLNPNGYDFKLLTKILQNASKLYCLNHRQKNVLRDLFNLEATLTYNGIPAKMIRTKSEIKKDEAQITITSIGALIPQKHINWVVKAVLSYEGEKEITLNLLGKGREESRLKEVAGNSKRVHFRGHLPRAQVLDELRKSHIFALPSVNETFGLVFIEAAANGNAIIGRFNDGIWKHFVPNEEIIYARTYEEFKKALYELIEDKNLRLTLGQKAYEKSKNFTWEKLQKEMTEDYEEVFSSFAKNTEIWSK